MLTLGSLFDGIGGFPLAAVHNGIVPVWASEIEEFPIKVTKIRFPDMIHVGDITKQHGAKLPASGRYLRRKSVPGFVGGGVAPRPGGGALRPLFRPGAYRKGDEEGR